MVQYFDQATKFAITIPFVRLPKRQPQHVWHGLGWRDTLAKLNSCLVL